MQNVTISRNKCTKVQITKGKILLVFKILEAHIYIGVISSTIKLSLHPFQECQPRLIDRWSRASLHGIPASGQITWSKYLIAEEGTHIGILWTNG